jgi:serine phosphatase RsbU (regulator of sigma subunit)
MAAQPILIGVAERPHPAETVNGDAYAVHWAGAGADAVCRIAVIDGLGHGPEAAEASARAIAVLDEQPALDPVQALHRCHAAMMGTRGAAMSVARLDPTRGELVYAGIGNVEAHLWQEGRRERLIAYRGIVGAAMRTIRPFTLRLGAGWLLLMHSDGISARADVEALGLLEPAAPADIAQAILDRYARAHDDALALVAVPHR